MDAIIPEMPNDAMDTTLQKRLRLRMDMMGMNAFQTAKKAGLGDSFVRDILRGKTRSPSVENLEKLARALDTTTDWFLSADESPIEVARVDAPIVGLEVVGTIQAGTWIDRSIVDDSGEYEIIPVARDPRFPHARQYSLKVSGDSMDLEYPDGSYVTCVDFYESGLQAKQGMVVHVERHNGPLVEATLKAIDIGSGETILVPRSSNPRHKPIKLNGDEGTQIVIRGAVIGSYRRVSL